MRTLAMSAGSDTRRRSRAVVTVGDVDRRQGLESACKLIDSRAVGDAPKLMTNAVVGGDVDVRLPGRRLRQHGVDLGGIWISAHHGARLSIDGLDLSHPVVFLDRRCEFMLADAVGRIVRKGSNGRKAGLRAAAPGEAIDVITRLGIAYEHPV